VLPLFEDATNDLIALQDGDAKKALGMALAYMSGCTKDQMANRSLLSGQEKFITFQMNLETTFNGVGLVWNILRRYLPESMTQGIAGMRALASMNGAAFDVEEHHVESFEDIFNHAKDSGNKMDFTIHRCLTLPDLLDKDGGVSGYAGGGYGG